MAGGNPGWRRSRARSRLQGRQCPYLLGCRRRLRLRHGYKLSTESRPRTRTEIAQLDVLNAGHRQADGTEYRIVHRDRKSTRLNSSHITISYAVFCLKKKKKKNT